MLDGKGFDLWAEVYDADVAESDASNTYPFAGHGDLLRAVYRAVLEKERPDVLELGFGTGALAARLYARGCGIWGQDFSGEMIAAAREKMPDAHLYQGDFSRGLVPELSARRYDFIIATYALHHLDTPGKCALIRALRDRLKPGGRVLIGDVAFATAEDLERCRAAAGEEWDEDEHYFVWDEMKAAFPDMTFAPVSFCAGLMTLEA